jgi:hypothetical protein
MRSQNTREELHLEQRKKWTVEDELHLTSMRPLNPSPVTTTSAAADSRRERPETADDFIEPALTNSSPMRDPPWICQAEKRRPGSGVAASHRKPAGEKKGEERHIAKRHKGQNTKKA